MAIRNFRWDDLASIVDVINRSQVAIGLEPDATENQIRYILTRYFDAERDCFVSETPAGALVGVGTMRFLHPPGTGLGVHSIVPEVHENEVGVELVRATNARLLERWVKEQPADIPMRVRRDAYNFETDKIALYEAEGYCQVGSTHWMILDLDMPVTPPTIPDGIILRPFDSEQQARAVYGLTQELFKNELGRSYEDWRDYCHLDEKWFDPTLWTIAWDGDKMVGVSICYSDIHEDPQCTGWIDLLGVRVAMRRRGIGEALLRQSLLIFQQHGFSKARTKPETDNPFGIVPMLQRIGLHIQYVQLEFEKVLRGQRTT
jgi:ribosomal protein S18 acetylase RimI-like enzyme